MRVTKVDIEKSSVEAGPAERYLVVDGVKNIKSEEFFNELHFRDTSANKRKATARGHHIIVVCSLDELQEQIVLINNICAAVDEKVRAHVEAIRRKNEEIRIAEDAKIQAAQDVYNGLKFD